MDGQMSLISGEAESLKKLSSHNQHLVNNPRFLAKEKPHKNDSVYPLWSVNALSLLFG